MTAGLFIRWGLAAISSVLVAGGGEDFFSTLGPLDVHSFGVPDNQVDSVFEVIEGVLESELLGVMVVVVESGYHVFLQERYLAVQALEVVACLLGVIRGEIETGFT